MLYEILELVSRPEVTQRWEPHWRVLDLVLVTHSKVVEWVSEGMVWERD